MREFQVKSLQNTNKTVKGGGGGGGEMTGERRGRETRG